MLYWCTIPGNHIMLTDKVRQLINNVRPTVLQIFSSASWTSLFSQIFKICSESVFEGYCPRYFGCTEARSTVFERKNIYNKISWIVRSNIIVSFCTCIIVQMLAMTMSLPYWHCKTGLRWFATGKLFKNSFPFPSFQSVCSSWQASIYRRKVAGLLLATKPVQFIFTMNALFPF